MAKLRASTLVEVIVSLTVISTVMAIATMIYINVISADDLTRRTEARLRVNTIVSQLKQDHQFTDFTNTENNITYQASFIPYDKVKHLVMMEVTATSTKDKLLYRHIEILNDE